MGLCPKCNQEHNDVDVFLATTKTCSCGCKIMSSPIGIVDAKPAIRQETRKVLGDVALLLLAMFFIWFIFGASALVSYSPWLAMIYATTSNMR